MQKQFIILFLVFLVLVPAGSLELTSSFDLGNMKFDSARMTDDVFPSDVYPWGLTLTGTQNLGTGLAVDFGYTKDRILNHLVHGTFSYAGDFFSIGAGPAFGIFNSREVILQPGISTNFRVEWPGIVFMNFDLFSSIGYQLKAAGDYSQAKNSISLGFYVPNAICTLNMINKTYDMITSAEQRQDSLSEYSFKTQIYQKNVPFKILVGLIYRQTTTVFSTQEFSGTTIADLTLETVTFSQKLNALLLQTRLDMAFSPVFSLFLDVHSSVFAFGNIEDSAADTQEALQIPTSLPEAFLFEASLGFKINLDNRSSAPAGE